MSPVPRKEITPEHERSGPAYHFTAPGSFPFFYSPTSSHLSASHLTITTSFTALPALTFYHFHFTPNAGFPDLPHPPRYRIAVLSFFIAFTALPGSNCWPLIDDAAGGRIDRSVGRLAMGRFLFFLYSRTEPSNNSVDGALIHYAENWAIRQSVRWLVA